MTQNKIDPAVSVFEEIDEQALSEHSGGQGWTTTLTTLTCYGVSWLLGNRGQVCTATKECQGSC